MRALGDALQIVTVEAERTLFDAGPVDGLCEVASIAPGGAVPGDVVCEEARLALVDAQASRVVSVLQSGTSGDTLEVDSVAISPVGHHRAADYALP